jgi:hypothetical protein
MVKNEINRLAKILEEEVQLSRQHFLRLRFPETYQVLLANNILFDYSMGFADNIGFRAGTSFSYYFFDLTKNQSTNLKITPFLYMDSALKDYLSYSPEKAIALILKMKREVQNVGGNFSFIWHNSSIHNSGEWKGWQLVLDRSISN